MSLTVLVEEVTGLRGKSNRYGIVRFRGKTNHFDRGFLFSAMGQSVYYRILYWSWQFGYLEKS